MKTCWNLDVWPKRDSETYVQWAPREFNASADHLANVALDEQSSLDWEADDLPNTTYKHRCWAPNETQQKTTPGEQTQLQDNDGVQRNQVVVDRTQTPNNYQKLVLRIFQIVHGFSLWDWVGRFCGARHRFSQRQPSRKQRFRPDIRLASRLQSNMVVETPR